MNLPTYITESNLVVIYFNDDMINYYDCNDEKICYDWRRYRKIKTMLNNSLRVTCCGDEVSLECVYCLNCNENI